MTETGAAIQFQGGVGEYQNVVASMIAQQQEDETRAKYLESAKLWIRSYNYHTEKENRGVTEANRRANRAAFNDNPEFAIEFGLTNSLGEAERITDNIKTELMIFFRITG